MGAALDKMIHNRVLPSHKGLENSTDFRDTENRIINSRTIMGRWTARSGVRV